MIKIKERMEYKIMSLFEIALVVSLSIAISYSINQIDNIKSNYSVESKKTEIYSILNKLIRIIWGNNFVSALEESDFLNGVYTCLKSKTGEICMEFIASKCNAKCEGACVPASRDKVAECKIGTCYDSSEGTCQVNSPKKACEDNSGIWFNDPKGNIAECKKGCCVLGNQRIFGTEQQCNKMSLVLGIRKIFKSELKTELECLASAGAETEGACVYEVEFERTCKLTTKGECAKITFGKGEFREGYLCSNPELNTTCKPQQRAGCIEGKDEVYWFDSCGNRENIYNSNKIISFNGGKLLSKEDSCKIGDLKNPLKNQRTCGNCNYLTGSVCGVKTAREKMTDSKVDFVCRDLSCIDSNGQKRMHGESWCEYQGSFGVDETKNRAKDSVGSRHFRMTCFDGEIRTEPCADYRNEICIESRTKIEGGKSFSSAACRINLANLCYQYNTEVSGANEAEIKASEAKRNEKCNKNPDCFLKTIDIDKYFKFDVCSPKYPPGFDLINNPEAPNMICGMGSQKCTVIYVKKLSGWKCEANCDCEDLEFAEKMNDMCMSLGDCGTKVNYIGDLTVNHRVYNDGDPGEDVSSSYLNDLKKYSTTQKGKYIDAGDLEEVYGALGIAGVLSPGEFEDPTSSITSAALMTSGVIGVPLIATAYLAKGSSIAIGAGRIIGPVLEKLTFGLLGKGLGGDAGAKIANPTMHGLGGTLAGAAVGLAVTSILIKVTGIGPGLGKGLTYALLAAGTFAGAIIGAKIVGFELLSKLFGLNIWIAIGLIFTIIVFKLMGIGKTDKRTIEFQCLPWQPPIGGAKCKECGKDGRPCSAYSCQALGQTCRLINEGTKDVACIDSNPNDVVAPIIESSTKLNECIKEYSPTIIEVKTNEPAQCKFDFEHTRNFDEMKYYFGDNIFKTNHSIPIIMPSLESIGVPGIDPKRKSDFNIYVRCQDSRGNKNIQEHAINFCVTPGDDLTAPLIVRREPISEYVAFNATSILGYIYTNEPAECRWDTRDRAYNLMANQMSCENEISRITVFGWKCKARMRLSDNTDKLFIRCLDQPWQNKTEKRNANTESFEFKIKKSQSALKILSINRDNKTIFSGVEPVSVFIEVETEGGAENGKADCYYRFGNFDILFSSTGDKKHTQVFESFTQGNKTLLVRCEDIAGNIAERTAKFEIVIDNIAPIVTRAYINNNILTIITNENAQCAYSSVAPKDRDACSFDFANSTLMHGNEKIHTTTANSEQYYIKCKDVFGNIPGECNIIIRRGVFG